MKSDCEDQVVCLVALAGPCDLHSLSEIWRNTNQKGSLLDALETALEADAVWAWDTGEGLPALFFVPSIEQRDQYAKKQRRKATANA